MPKKKKESEGYPPNWQHCHIHLNPDTGEMHSDGNHKVREYIQALQSRLSDLQQKITKEVNMSEIHIVTLLVDHWLKTTLVKCNGEINTKNYT